MPLPSYANSIVIEHTFFNNHPVAGRNSNGMIKMTATVPAPETFSSSNPAP